MTDTLNRIKTVINKFNDDCAGQANLASPHARTDLAELIYNAVMKQNLPNSTINTQSVFRFSNNTDTEHK